MIQNLRLTVQATPRNKFGFFWDEQTSVQRRHLVVRGRRMPQPTDFGIHLWRNRNDRAGGRRDAGGRKQRRIRSQVPTRPTGHVVVTDDQPSTCSKRASGRI